MKPIERQKQQVGELLSELAAHRWDKVVELFSGDSPCFEDVPANTRLTGKAGIVYAYQALAKALPDLQIEIVHAIDGPGCSIREMIFSGTHLGSYHGLEAKGQTVRFACACFFLFDANCQLSTTERIYFDNETVRNQMIGQVQPYLPQPLRIAA